MILDNELKPGDIVSIKQKNGCTITIHAYENGIGVKAEQPGTRMEVKRDSSFWVKCEAVNSDTDKG